MTIRGSCMCGKVRFEIEGTPKAMGTCHCSRCRKLGTSTIVFVQRDQFTLRSGEDQIKTVVPEAPHIYHRSFCTACGTALGEPLSPEESFPLNAECLDDDPGLLNGFHECVEDRPVWAASVISTHPDSEKVDLI